MTTEIKHNHSDRTACFSVLGQSKAVHTLFGKAAHKVDFKEVQQEAQKKVLALKAEAEIQITAESAKVSKTAKRSRPALPPSTPFRAVGNRTPASSSSKGTPVPASSASPANDATPLADESQKQ